jgi:lipopolysaccharide/colanic/teichoic acid biosynthesis glycosyltransferase
MDSARLDSDASAHDALRSHAGGNETATLTGRPEGIGTATHGPRNGSAKQRIRDTHAQLIGNGNGAGTLALPRPGTLDLAPSEERYERQHGVLARGIKRAVDIVGAVLLIAILAPTWLMMAVLIKADSPGPILFRQRRIGRDGKAFWMVKFRTMVDGADAQKQALLHLNEAAEGLFKIDGDPRVTRVGRWLRATSLDELPQLLHVVTGKMSLVGPRPLVPEEDARIVGSQRGRLQMRPGMTGVWQVGGASSIPIHEMVKLDTAYVDDWSLWTDLKLIAVTAGHVVLRKGL